MAKKNNIKNKVQSIDKTLKIMYYNTCKEQAYKLPVASWRKEKTWNKWE
nr:MAG TPA: hypothetical protein [Caudoviricetes sp.]